MKYRDIIGFSNKKQKFVKKTEKKVAPKPTVPPVTELLKKEFGSLNEWTSKPPTEKRWSGAFTAKDGLTEFERKGGKDNVNEGPAYEYAANLKAIEKSYKTFKTEVFKFANLLEKKGLKKEAGIFEKSFSKKAGDWYRFFERQVRKLM